MLVAVCSELTSRSVTQPKSIIHVTWLVPSSCSGQRHLGPLYWVQTLASRTANIATYGNLRPQPPTSFTPSVQLFSYTEQQGQNYSISSFYLVVVRFCDAATSTLAEVELEQQPYSFLDAFSDVHNLWTAYCLLYPRHTQLHALGQWSSMLYEEVQLVTQPSHGRMTHLPGHTTDRQWSLAPPIDHVRLKVRNGLWKFWSHQVASEFWLWALPTL